MTTASVLPTGTLTFVFTDVEGSTRLAQAYPAAFDGLIGRHRELLRGAFAAHGGVEVATEGDGMFAVFPLASEAVAATVDAQRALAAEGWPPGQEILVRMGMHTGAAALREGSYIGHDVNRAARIAAVAHGGQILVSEATAPLVGDSLPAGCTLRALGYHRLKDLRPEHLCQLDVDGLPTEFPPIRSLDARRNNLPTQLTSFVGREAEVREVAELLERARLVTLTGPGGTGKTRLSLQVAAHVADRFPDGVTWVALAELSDPTLVASEIAASLGLPEAGGRSPRDRIVAHVRDGEALLVIDNFEQVVDAAPLIADLLREAPRLRILVSSRIVLRVSGEHEFAVPPLGLPEPIPDSAAAAAESEAVRLFVERAVAARPGFVLDAANAAAVAEIVSRLDGLPLAIELAAARSRVLPPQALLARLGRGLDMLVAGARDVPARQQTLRGAIAWSHDLLDEPHRRLFARFSAFVGGARMEEAEAVCGPAHDLGVDVLDGLGALVESSLVGLDEVDGEPRFRMLVTIQEFAAEQLARSGEESAVRARHVEAYLVLAEAAAPHLTGPDGARQLDLLAREHDNLQAAIGWGIDRREAAVAARFLSALWRFWQIRGHLVQGHRCAEQVVKLVSGELPATLRAAAYEAAGGLAYWVGDSRAAVDHYESQLAAARATGEAVRIAQALYNLAFPLTFAGIDHARARSAAREAASTFRAIDDRAGMARTLVLLANVAYGEDDMDAARRYALESLPMLAEIGDPFLLGWALYTLAVLALVRRDLEEGRRRLLEALERFEAAGDMTGLTIVLDAMAYVERESGEPYRAARISGAVERLEAASGTGVSTSTRRRLSFDPSVMKHDPATAAAWGSGARARTDEIVAFVRDRGATAASTS